MKQRDINNSHCLDFTCVYRVYEIRAEPLLLFSPPGGVNIRLIYRCEMWWRLDHKSRIDKLRSHTYVNANYLYCSSQHCEKKSVVT